MATLELAVVVAGTAELSAVWLQTYAMRVTLLEENDYNKYRAEGGNLNSKPYTSSQEVF